MLAVLFGEYARRKFTVKAAQTLIQEKHGRIPLTTCEFAQIFMRRPEVRRIDEGTYQFVASTGATP